jgi:putative molybdopterin biosynthesis protein
MSDFDRPFYTIPEAAAKLRVHENTLYNMIRRGELEHYKVGKQIRLSAAELEKLKVPAKNDPN